MAIFEVRSAVPTDALDAIEEILLGREDPRWSIGEDMLAKTAWVAGLFESESEAHEAWGVLRPLLPVSAEPEVRELEDVDWRESYKLHFKPWRIGRLHWVPVWERDVYRLPEGDAVVWLDPGMAFGTGNHETTRLCVERLLEFDRRPREETSVIDAGCGSGILAISAAKLGFGAVAGFDNDAEAVRIAKENADLNEVATQVCFFQGDLTTGFASGAADVVVANILANVLIEFASQLVAAVKPGGELVLGGILAEEIGAVRAAYAMAASGWEADSRVLGEWADLQLRRP